MLAIARRSRRARGVRHYGRGDALALPFADGRSTPCVTQVYEYVADMPAALAEARRVLRPGGRLLVLDTDWDSIVWHSSDRDPMAGAGRMGRAPRRPPPAAPARRLIATPASPWPTAVIPLLNAGYDRTRSAPA